MPSSLSIPILASSSLAHLRSSSFTDNWVRQNLLVRRPEPIDWDSDIDWRKFRKDSEELVRQLEEEKTRACAEALAQGESGPVGLARPLTPTEIIEDEDNCSSFNLNIQNSDNFDFGADTMDYYRDRNASSTTGDVFRDASATSECGDYSGSLCRSGGLSPTEYNFSEAHWPSGPAEDMGAMTAQDLQTSDYANDPVRVYEEFMAILDRFSELYPDPNEEAMKIFDKFFQVPMSLLLGGVLHSPEMEEPWHYY